LLNSSVSSARRAIEKHNLPATTKAYGSPEDLANDPDVQLVVCATRVDKHLETTLPSIKAGKDVFVEWPLAPNIADATLLVEAARVAGGRTVVGTQAHASSYVQKIKEIIDSGRIGKVLSTSIAANAYIFGYDPLPSSMAYLGEKKYGVGFVDVFFAHCEETLSSTPYVTKQLNSHSRNPYSPRYQFRVLQHYFSQPTNRVPYPRSGH
jgi:predicted dehydrogenase